MTVAKNVAFGLEERRLPRAEIAARVDEALALVGLTHLADRRPSQLSGGQQQRVAVARTVAVRPKVLLLDEPLSNLDAKLRVQVRRELRDLQRKLGITTIFVTHDQEEANTTCDRIAVMHEGVVQQVGTPMELYSRPANLFVAGFLGTANILEGSRTADQFTLAGGTQVTLPVGLRGGTPGARLVFRPQDARIMTDAEHEAGPEALHLSGRIVHREFLGGAVRYAIAVDRAEIAVDAQYKAGVQLHETGSPVRVAVPAASALWLAA
jgi:iron(III) transport system ATP-binding protein